jgi:hypothetical protein
MSTEPQNSQITNEPIKDVDIKIGFDQDNDVIVMGVNDLMLGMSKEEALTVAKGLIDAVNRLEYFSKETDRDFVTNNDKTCH